MLSAFNYQTEEIPDSYPSRNGNDPSIAERLDPICWGEQNKGPLGRQLLEEYSSSGFMILPQFFSPSELHEAWEEISARQHDPSQLSREEVFCEIGADSQIRSIFDVHRDDSALARLACHPRLVQIARQILGPDVYVHQSRVNYKPGFKGQGFYWHSDFETWHVEDGMPRMKALSISILLTDNYPHNGPLMLIPGSHHLYLSCAGTTPKNHYQKSLRLQQLGIPDRRHLSEVIGRSCITTATGPAGTVIAFDCNTLHGSNTNISPDPRSNLFVVYNRLDNALVSPYCGLEPRPEFIAHRRSMFQPE